jgi:hypothetical protein
MKIATCNIVITTLALTAVSHGASIQAANTPDLSGSTITDHFIENASADTLLSTGFAGFGGFSISDSDVTNAIAANNFALLISSFTPFVGTDDFLTGMVGLNGAATAGAYAINADPFSVTPYIGQNLYTFVGDGSSLATSAAFVLFKHTETLVADPGGTSVPNSYSYDLSATNGTLLVGTRDTFSGFTDANFGLTAADVSTVKMFSPIPEPSALLLCGVGSLALLRRKR